MARPLREGVGPLFFFPNLKKSIFYLKDFTILLNYVAERQSRSFFDRFVGILNPNIFGIFFFQNPFSAILSSYVP